MSNELYRDFIDTKADSIINSLGGTITPAPANAELYRDFLDRKFDDVINACSNRIKIHTYTGNNNVPNNIIMPEIPRLIVGLTRRSSDNISICNYLLSPIEWGIDLSAKSLYKSSSGSLSLIELTCSYNDNIITLTGTNASQSFNSRDITYYVYYI
ncbi:MAG: hypothetical protein J6S67_02795 [Methanobrevibacter sp.]|nr:hypothetical protein [Methanobrevibacter sp.]